MKFMGVAMSPGTIAVWTLILAAVSALGTWLTVPAVQEFFRPKTGNAALSEQATRKVYAGQVTTEAGQAIPNARVLVSQDESVGQAIRTDSNGQFQVRLSAEVKSLRLTVSAEGFSPAKIEGNINRTGPEEIILRALPVSPQVKAKPIPLESKPLKPQEIARTPQNAPAAPVPSVSAPNGVAIGGNNYGSPTVNNYEKPTPPPRLIPPEAKRIFVTKLSVVRGSRVTLQAVGGDGEVFDLADALQSLFAESGWTVQRMNTGTLHNMYMGPSGRPEVSNGDGLTCEEFDQHDHAALLAISAIKELNIGAKVVHHPDVDDNRPDRTSNLTITVGSRL